MSSIYIKRYLPTILITVTSLLLILEYFSGNPILQKISGDLSSWAAIIIAFSLGVAFLSMVYVRTKRLISMKPGEWYYNAIFLAALFMQLFLGLVYGTNNYYYTKIWTNINLSAYSAMSATTALYIISSAYRVMRVKKKEAIPLLIVAIFVMIGQTSLGAAIWPGFPMIRNWIWDNPAAASMRGITIVTAIGGVALTLRIISGITRVIGSEVTKKGEEEY